MTVAFIVRENIDVTDTLIKILERVITQLVVKEWASSFLFTGVGEFDSVCYDLVTKLKNMFPDIERTYCRSDSYSKRDIEWISASYEKWILPDKNEVMSYETRDNAMIDRCDVLVTYCDIDFQLTAKWLSCTATAVAYAWKKKKRIINLFKSNKG